MDLTYETELNNGTLFDSNLNSNGLQNNGTEDSLFHLVNKIKAIGITELFKKLSANSRNCVFAYIVMFLIGAPGNLYVVTSLGCELWKKRFMRSSGYKLLIWHLALADLFVTCFVIPIEIFWRLTIKWYGGNTLCKSIQFVRTFGLYLSSMVIICISMDRFCAIVFPMRSLGGMKRIQKMLLAAWIFSFLFASPQIVIFNTEKHPLYPSFRFCTNSHYFHTFNMEILYNLLSLGIVYFAPLTVIIVTYGIVFITISRKSSEQRQQNTETGNHLRQSGNVSQITRAKNKAKWISMLIVSVFVICWTPFAAAMQLWYMFDFKTAERLLDPRIREALFVTAVSNSCLNPFIYSNYMKRYYRCFVGCPQALGENTVILASAATPATSFHLNIMNGSVSTGATRRRISGNTHHV